MCETPLSRCSYLPKRRFLLQPLQELVFLLAPILVLKEGVKKGVGL